TRRRSFRLSPEIRHSVNRGFKFLLRRQAATNSFQSEPYPVAMNALVGLAHLAGGTTPLEGKDPDSVRSVRLCLQTLLKMQEKSGVFSGHQSRSMYGHGFATLFLAQVYGTSGELDRKVRDALRRAIRVIEASQRKEGGWDYSPDPGAIPGGQNASDTSITVCQTMALRAANNLGFNVDKTVIRRARRYIQKMQKDDGSFRYRTGMEFLEAIAGRSAFPRSAAGVCILYSLGEYSTSHIRKGLAYLESNYEYYQEAFPFYGQYYCSQALFQVGGRRWNKYYKYISRRLLTDQNSDGAWRAHAKQLEIFPPQTTAMALIVLQLPYRYLPIHER
ncbi:MAG: prenyltransferase/squalene oxidase repeat-containing protein, partial [Planctomycetota bacterium]